MCKKGFKGKKGHEDNTILVFLSVICSREKHFSFVKLSIKFTNEACWLYSVRYRRIGKSGYMNEKFRKMCFFLQEKFSLCLKKFLLHEDGHANRDVWRIRKLP